MLSTDFDYSDFCQSLIIGIHDVDIEIFRSAGTFAWTLEMQVDGKPVEWPHVFLADGVVAQTISNSERALPETEFRRCVRNLGGQVRSSG